MKTIFLKTITITAFLGFLIPAFVFAQSPGIPHQFFGTVQFASGTTSDGLSVEAKINGVVVGSSVTASGNYGYNPNLLFVTDNQSANVGKTVEFYVAGTKANETAIFANGNSSQLNLTIPTPTTPTPSSSNSSGSSSGSTTGSSGGSSGGVAVNTTTIPAVLSAAAQKVDANKDGKIDVLDFNTLMVNWGKTTANNIADFSGDGKVDIFDFNMLMINWTK